MHRLSPISSHARSGLAVLVVVTLLTVTAMTPAGIGAAEVRLVTVASGFDQPLFVTGAGTGRERLFVVERPGRIRIVDAGTVLDHPFLDITGIVNDREAERGLLGLAFHPNYERNGFFYVDYTDANGDIVIARYTVSADLDRADAGSAQVILTIRHRQAATHHGGMLAFGLDGYLYIAVGDGGKRQSANAQKTTTLLGIILRIDVNRAADGHPYAIPPDNPFAGSGTARPEIWAYGLRNPFRFSFDRLTGDLFIGDVGLNAWEEIDFAEGGRGGINYGWAIMEGDHCFDPPTGCDTTGLTRPIYEYSHEVGNVVTGGYVYRGTQIPSLVGTYVFTDFGSKDLWGLTRDVTGTWERSVLFHAEDRLQIASFGESDAGELFAIDLVAGTLSRIEAA